VVLSRDSDAAEDLRRRLLDAALELLQDPDTPLDLRKVAERAGKSRTAPYLVFGKGPGGGVMALRIAVAAEGSRIMQRMMIDAYAEGGDPFESLRAVAAAFLTFAERNARLFRLMYGPEINAIAGLGKGGFLEHPEFEKLLEYRDSAGQVVSELIYDAQERGLLPQDPPHPAGPSEEVPSVRYLQIAWATMIGVSVLREDDLLQAIGWDVSLEQGARLVAESVLGVDPGPAEDAKRTFLAAKDMSDAAQAGPQAARRGPALSDVASMLSASSSVHLSRDLDSDERSLRDVASMLSVSSPEHRSRDLDAEEPSLTAVLDQHTGLRRAAYSPALVRGAHILWIDDHPNWVANIADTLRHLGATVTVVPGTREALDHLGRAEDEPPRVILSDIARGTNPRAGTEAIPALRKAAPGVPIIFNIAQYDERLGKPEGAFGITNKLDELFHLILDALEGRERSERT